MENLSLNTSLSSSSRDFVQQFMSSPVDLSPKDDENEEVELNLGLSLGGRLGVDRATKKLMRSSSVATCLPVVRDDDSTDKGGSLTAPPPTGLVRTSSLPMVSEEEWRKRKEVHSLRRMKAKRKRSEKQRESKAAQGGSSGELSTGSIQSIPEGCNQETGYSAVRPVRPDPEGSSRTPRNRGGPKIGVSALDMPSVFTIPNGRRVDGILYKYGKGEEVKIMCVCHGTFHSPGGFVMHAGGPDEDNPLKHIVMNANVHPLV